MNADEITFSYANSEDIPALVRLEYRVAEGLPSPDMLVVDDESFYHRIIKEEGCIPLAWKQGELVAAACLRFPSAQEPGNWGRLCGLAPDQLGRVAHLESGYMLPEVRGLSVISRLVLPAMQRSIEQGRDIFASTAWPCNAGGLGALLSFGLRIRQICTLYGGKKRFVLLRTPEPRPLVEHLEQRIPCDDFAGHEALLREGWIGVGIEAPSEEQPLHFQVIYRKLWEVQGTTLR